MTEATDLALSGLATRVRAYFAQPEVGAFTVEAFAPMADGHAGRTFGVQLRDHSGELTWYILKLGPEGVRRSGSTDIYRQVPLLAELGRSGLPVPTIAQASARDGELGAPFILMSRLPGRSYIVWEPAPVFMAAETSLPSLWLAGARALAAVHRIEHRSLLGDWEDATSLSAEIARWSALIRHSDHERQVELTRLSDALRASVPDDAPVGLVHGDFQPGNLLFEGGAISGIIDWDLCAIGPQGMDLGWFLMMADADCWHPSWRPVGSAPRDAIIGSYAAAGGPVERGLAWHQAFAHFRLGAITGLNLKLHRNGRRVDAVWERFSLSVPPLLDCAFDLLARKDAT